MHLSPDRMPAKRQEESQVGLPGCWKRQLFTHGHSALKRAGILIYSHKIKVGGDNHIAGEWVSVRASCSQRQDLALGTLGN